MLDNCNQYLLNLISVKSVGSQQSVIQLNINTSMTSSPYITLTMLVKLYIFKPRE